METHWVLYPPRSHLPPLIVQTSPWLWTCSPIALQRRMQGLGGGEETGFSSTICKCQVPTGAVNLNGPHARPASLGIPGEPGCACMWGWGGDRILP